MKYKSKCPICGSKVSLSYFFRAKSKEVQEDGMIWECNGCDFKEDAGPTITTKTFQNLMKAKLNKAIRKLESGKFTISDYLKLEKNIAKLKL